MYEFAGLLLVRLLSSRPVPRRPTLAEEDAYYERYGEVPWHRARKIFARLSGRAKPPVADCEGKASRCEAVAPAMPYCLKGEYGEDCQDAAGGKAEGGRAPKKSAAIVLRPGNGDCTCSAI